MTLGEWYEREYNSSWSVDVLNDPQVMRKWAAYLEYQSVSADFVDIQQLQKLWERVDQAAAKCKEMESRMNLDRQNSGFGIACAHANTIHPGKYFGTTNKETMESYLCTWKEDGSELVYGVKVGGLTKRHFRDAALKLAMKAKANDFTGLYHMESTRQGIRATLIS